MKKRSSMVSFLRFVAFLTLLLSFLVPIAYAVAMKEVNPGNSLSGTLLFLIIFPSGVVGAIFWFIMAYIVERLEVLDRINKNLVEFFRTFEKEKLTTDH